MGCIFGTYGCYGIKKCSNNIDECTTNTECSGETTVTKYTCSGIPNYTCSEDSNGTYSSLSSCQSACVSPTPTRYSCNTSNWTCFVNPNSIYTLAECQIVCQPGGILHCPGNDYCYACNKSTYQCYHLKSGTYSTLSSCQKACKPPSSPPIIPPVSPPPTCQIFEFSLNGKTNEDQDPLIVWVKASLKGYFSVNDTCKICTVSSNDIWGNPLKTYSITTLDSDFTETFKIETAGTYAYTLKCIGTDPEDIATDALSLQTVQAVNLPWWREIIPYLNLQGFLRGLLK